MRGLAFCLRCVLDYKGSQDKGSRHTNRKGKQMTTKVAIKPAVRVDGKPAVELTEAGIKALKAFNKAKATEAKAKATKAKAEAILRAELGEATTATIQGVAVASVVASKNTSFDRDLMREVYPEAFEATLKTTEYTYIKTA